MFGLAECWKPKIFFIQDVTPVNICCSLYSTGQKQTESQHLGKTQHLAEQTHVTSL